MRPPNLCSSLVVSNEPGYYEEEDFGIRIENLLLVVEKVRMGEFAGRKFLGFEKLTHIPLQHKLINFDLMTPSEIKWLDTYHRAVREQTGRYIKSDRAKRWLETATQSVKDYLDSTSRK